ncbi:MAG: peptide chain release factor 3, partial [Hyphomicrobium sp.]
LDVLADRLTNEYNLQIIFETCPYETVRWFSSEDKTALENFIAKNKNSIATDLDGDQIFMAQSLFNLGWVKEKNPNIHFVDIKTNDSHVVS